MKLNKIIAIVTVALLTSNCSGFIKKHQENVVVDSYGHSELKDKKFIESLREGKTTRKYIENKLGKPGPFAQNAKQYFNIAEGKIDYQYFYTEKYASRAENLPIIKIFAPKSYKVKYSLLLNFSTRDGVLRRMKYEKKKVE